MQATWLPALLRDIAEAFGLPVALRLAELFGGQYVYLPRTPHAEHKVAKAMGVEVLAALMRHEHQKPGGGEDRIVIPRGPKPDGAEMLRAVAERQGRSANDIAAELRLHVRQVHRLRARLRMQHVASAQASLFHPREESPPHAEHHPTSPDQRRAAAGRR